MLIINDLNSAAYSNHNSCSKQRGNSKNAAEMSRSKFHFLQASTVNCSFLFQTKVEGQWYIIPSTCDVALDFQTKIEGQWNVMPRGCGRRNVVLYKWDFVKLARFMP